MSKRGITAQWIFAVIFGICTLGNGLHWTSLPLLIATVLMMPIPALRKKLNELNLKNWLIITLAVIVFIFGMVSSPDFGETNLPDDNPAYSGESTPEVDETPAISSSEVESSTPEEVTDKEETPVAPSDETTPAETESSSPVETPSATEPIPSETDPIPTESTSSVLADTEPDPVGNGIATPVDPKKLPSYSSSPYVVVNDNIPSFSSAELKTIGYESYSNLDSLGRCGVAIASCGKEIMPAEGEERGSISSIKPTGWVQASYSGVSGGYLWNRCHLIGWQLSAENANKKNLITGTRYMNVEGMLPFENMVADYIQETNNHVAFRVTPIFEGNNLVCSGVQIEAYSIEDNGEGIMFNVYCYNVQPGITIDYATGNSFSNSQQGGNNNQTESETTPETSAPGNDNDNTEMVWIPSSGSKYHSKSSCSNMKNPTQVTKDEAERRGYTPCKKCY